MAASQWTGASSTDANTAGNFSPSGVPVSADDLSVRNSSVSIAASLNKSAVTLATLDVYMSMTGAIGTTAAYYQTSATNWRMGLPGGGSTASAGNGLWKVDFGSNVFTGIVVSSSTSSTESGLEPIRILGSNAGNKLYVQGGRVGVATTLSNETATLSQFSISGGTLNLGSGCTLTTGYQSGGTLTVNSAMTTFTQESGIATLQGSVVVRNQTIGGTTYNNQRPAAKSATITRTSTTATVTSAGHGYSNGDTIYISGANEANYNGYFTISNIATDTFDYTISSTAPSPATGTITCIKSIASLTIQENGVADFSLDGRDVYVAAITFYPGGELKANSANPGHLHYGTLTLVSTGAIKAAN